MAGNVWTVKPDSTKIDLVYVRRDDDTGAETSHPFWIKLKKRLTVGEQRRVMTSGWRGVRGVDGGGEVQVDWQRSSFARTTAYLVDWSLTDENDKPLNCNDTDVVEALDPSVYALIENAISKHVESVEKEKNVQTGRP